jgi:hypothetical protein
MAAADSRQHRQDPGHHPRWIPPGELGGQQVGQPGLTPVVRPRGCWRPNGSPSGRSDCFMRGEKIGDFLGRLAGRVRPRAGRVDGPTRRAGSGLARHGRPVQRHSAKASTCHHRRRGPYPSRRRRDPVTQARFGRPGRTRHSGQPGMPPGQRQEHCGHGGELLPGDEPAAASQWDRLCDPVTVQGDGKGLPVFDSIHDFPRSCPQVALGNLRVRIHETRVAPGATRCHRHPPGCSRTAPTGRAPSAHKVSIHGMP